MTVKQFASVARCDANHAIAYNGNAYPFNPEDDFQMLAYGDFEISHVDLSALSPDQVEAVVSAYAEAAGCDKSQLLTSFTAYITAYQEAEGVTVERVKNASLSYYGN